MPTQTTREIPRWESAEQNRVVERAAASLDMTMRIANAVGLARSVALSDVRRRGAVTDVVTDMATALGVPDVVGVAPGHGVGDISGATWLALITAGSGQQVAAMAGVCSPRRQRPEVLSSRIRLRHLTCRRRPRTHRPTTSACPTPPTLVARQRKLQRLTRRALHALLAQRVESRGQLLLHNRAQPRTKSCPRVAGTQYLVVAPQPMLKMRSVAE